MTGVWPNLVDHADGNKDNNQWDNIRDATREQNGQNQRLRIDNQSRLKGVFTYNDGRVRRFYSRIKVAGAMIQLGSFVTAEEAHAAYTAAARQYFGEYARTE